MGLLHEATFILEPLFILNYDHAAVQAHLKRMQLFYGFAEQYTIINF